MTLLDRNQMIKLLHTADWHIGQTLHGEDRSQEQQDIRIPFSPSNYS